MKRKNTTQENHLLHPTKFQHFQLNNNNNNNINIHDNNNDDNNNNNFLDLSLSLSLNNNNVNNETNNNPPPQQQPPPPPPSQPPPNPAQARRNPTNPRKSTTKVTKPKTIPPPYPWATDHRARVHTIPYLQQNGVHTISGQVHCKKCEKTYNIDFNLVEKFKELAIFINEGQDGWHNRAPERWTSPRLLKCKNCGEYESVKPLISEKKKSINWLFLLLGQFIGCCTLEQLKYFCKHAKIHRTGAKDRLIYLIYFALCNQLQPGGPFN